MVVGVGSRALSREGETDTGCAVVCCAVLCVWPCRPTVFVEVIERLGCTKEVQRNGAAAESAAAQPAGGNSTNGAAAAAAAAADELTDVIEVRADGVVVEQAAGCGGFGKGNFSELFKR
jgi:hypothetical protein